jgi:hypothetical protein
MHLPGDGHMSAHNILQVYGLYNKYTYVYLLVWYHI